MAAPSSNEVLHDFFPLMREFKDGRLERYCGTEFVPPSLDAQTGVRSKDIVISPDLNLSARIFLPANADPAKKLPLLLYIHGGGFVVESAFSPLYTKHLNHLVAESNAVAISLNYRLAPEHPLPAAYDDSWLALKWIASGSANEEEWVNDFADLDRFYLGGDSAGANIASNVAIRFGIEKSVGNGIGNRINLRGVFLNCPYFCGEYPIDNEESHRVFPYVYLAGIWRYVCPSSTGCDDPRINPARDPDLGRFGGKRLLVYVAEKDALRGRGWVFKEVISKSGWSGEVEVVEVEGEDHVFSVHSPTSENGIAMLKRVACFLNL